MIRPLHSLLCATILLFGLAVAQAAAGSGRAATETRDASGFSAISLRGDINLVVRQGAREAVQVSADDNLLPLLETTVDGSGERRTLRIGWKAGELLHTRAKAVVTVDVLRLDKVAAAGSGGITVEALKTPSLTLSIAGSSSARLTQIDTDRLKLSIAGAGDVQAAGKAATLEVSIAGSGDVRTDELAADDVSVSIAGSGDARVLANKTLAVSIAGSGDVEYSGGATLARSRVAGSGSIRQRP